jgi:hypothetical protein
VDQGPGADEVEGREQADGEGAETADVAVVHADGAGQHHPGNVGWEHGLAPRPEGGREEHAFHEKQPPGTTPCRANELVVGGCLYEGRAESQEVEDYSHLTPEDLELARLYVRAYPRVGRPRVPSVAD